MARPASVVALLCLGLTACSAGFSGGPMAKLNVPAGDFADRQGTGYTLGAQADFALAVVSIYGDAGWTRFGGAEFEGEETDAIDFFELAGGARLLLGPVFLGGQYGYATGDLEQSILRPELGLRIGPLTAFAQYQSLDDTWWSIGGTFSFF